jgi:ABC-type multidrug transport system fused ATPase/permease subunit
MEKNIQSNPNQDEHSLRIEIMKNYSSSLEMRPEIMVFGLKNWIIKEYQNSTRLLSRFARPEMVITFRAQFLEYLSSSFETGMRALMYLLVAFKPHHFDIPLASLAYLEQASHALYNKMTSLQTRLGNTVKDMQSIRDLFECLELESSLKSPEKPVTYDTTSNGGRGMKVELRHITFKYPGQNQFVLKDVSFVVEPGETLAMLGFNGSGNTSFISLRWARKVYYCQIVG